MLWIFFSCTFLGPESRIVTLHTYLSQFLSTLLQRIWLSVKNFIHTDQDYLCSNSSQKTTFQCPLFKLKKTNHQTAIFNFYLSLGFFSLEFYYLSYLTYSLQRIPIFKVINISRQNSIYERDIQHSQNVNRKEAISSAWM